MKKFLTMVSVALLVFTTSASALSLEYNIESDVEKDLDLNGDGTIDLSLLIEPSIRVLIRNNDQILYEAQGSEVGFFVQSFIEDFNGDGAEEIVVVERNQSNDAVNYRLFALTTESLVEQVDAISFKLEESAVRTVAIRQSDITHNGDKHLIVKIRKKSDQHGVEYLSSYNILTVANNKWQVVKSNQDNNLVDLRIVDGNLLEKYAVTDQQGVPSGLEKKTLKWNGSSFQVSNVENLDAYYSDPRDIDDLTQLVAKEQGIPVEILKAVMQQESWGKQFDQGECIISFDNGIGIMQVTPSNGEVKVRHLGITYRGQDIERLKEDVYFNIKVGAQILYDKWLYSFGYNRVLPWVGNMDQNHLESWYFALWAYNGYVMQNFPSRTWGTVYQEKVIDHMPGFEKNQFSYHELTSVFEPSSLPVGGLRYPLVTPTKGKFDNWQEGEVVKPLVSTYLRTEPGIYLNRIGVVGKGSSVSTISIDGQWAQVNILRDTNGVLTGKTGYISSNYVGNGIATADVHLRSTPEFPQNILGEIQVGDRILIKDKVDTSGNLNWYHIEIVASEEISQGTTGYAALPADLGTSLNPGDTVTIQKKVKLRSFPSIYREQVNAQAALTPEDTLIIIDGPTSNMYDGHLWYRVRDLATDQQGYVSLASIEARAIKKPQLKVQYLDDAKYRIAISGDVTADQALTVNGNPIILQPQGNEAYFADVVVETGINKVRVVTREGQGIPDVSTSIIVDHNMDGLIVLGNTALDIDCLFAKDGRTEEDLNEVVELINNLLQKQKLSLEDLWWRPADGDFYNVGDNNLVDEQTILQQVKTFIDTNSTQHTNH